MEELRRGSQQVTRVPPLKVRRGSPVTVNEDVYTRTRTIGEGGEDLRTTIIDEQTTDGCYSRHACSLCEGGEENGYDAKRTVHTHARGFNERE